MMFGYNTWEDFTPLDKIKGLTRIKSPYIVVHISIIHCIWEDFTPLDGLPKIKGLTHTQSSHIVVPVSIYIGGFYTTSICRLVKWCKILPYS